MRYLSLSSASLSWLRAIVQELAALMVLCSFAATITLWALIFNGIW